MHSDRAACQLRHRTTATATVAVAMATAFRKMYSRRKESEMNKYLVLERMGMTHGQGCTVVLDCPSYDEKGTGISFFHCRVSK